MEEFTISDLQKEMQTGELTSRECVNQYIERIQYMDPQVCSVSEINPDALDIANNLDSERSKGIVRGPLHGVPVLVKENIDTADRMQTTAGSLSLIGNIAKDDAYLVGLLRNAGAVILGKTNLSEWANFRSSKSTSGWSSRGGLTRNPYALDRSACGSSSGSGAAVAANFCTAAVGTETDGSIVCPAQTNGIVGIKPTLGRISRSGIIPIAHSQDTAGPMARTVGEAAILLQVMSGSEKKYKNIPETFDNKIGDLSLVLIKSGLAGARLGVSRNYFGFDDRVDKIMEHCIDVIKSLGAEVVDPANVDNESKYAKSELEVLLYEFQADVNNYLAQHPTAPLKTMVEIAEYNKNHKSKMMPYFGQERIEQAIKKGPLTQIKYLRALEKNIRLSRAGIDDVLEKNHLDAIIAPTGGPAWMIDLINGDNYPGGCSSPAAVSGYPHITVPAGYVFGLPVGLSIFSTAWTDWKLVQYAYAFEQATKVRNPPTFLKSVDLNSDEISW